LFLVGDSVTISSNKKLTTLVNYLGDTADVRSGFEFMNAVDGNVSMRSKPANSNPKRAERKFETEAERRARFAATFAGFVADPRFETHTFPSILNSFERMLVHELAEEHGLGHISLGEDAERRIRVWRPAADAADAAEPPAPQPLRPDERDLAAPTTAGPTSTTHDADTTGGQEIASVRETATVVNAAVPSTRVAVDTNTAHSDKSKLGSEPSTTTVASTVAAVAAAEPAGTRCPVCRHKVPDANIDIHIVRCERKQRLEDKSRTLDATARKQHRGAHPASGNPAKSGGPSSDALSTEDSASDDAEIHRFTQNAQKCQKGGCPRSVVQIGSFCRHCSRTYCMAHSLPESHGCATAAATSARRHRSGDAPLLGGARSAPPRANNPNDPRSRTQLEKSLKSALQDKESARTPTAKGKDGKKKDTKKKKKKK
jgi:ATP-dependent RNA/DNA helicase IGHMBP2